ncbi:MAG: hypothetical protein ONB07_01865 [candidate division KSB1 bacterium]|nr:hypothetical protein [candidate division KSB1 bacterium]MDZ7392651.1 hypothetical protein [candidate division KSB1 bacterium]
MADGRGFVDLVSFLSSRQGQGEPLGAVPRRVIPSHRVKVEPNPVQIGAGGHCGGEPKVRVHTRDNVVQRIEILCACGRTIELALDYGDGRTAEGQRS